VGFSSYITSVVNNGFKHVLKNTEEADDTFILPSPSRCLQESTIVFLNSISIIIYLKLILYNISIMMLNYVENLKIQISVFRQLEFTKELLGHAKVSLGSIFLHGAHSMPPTWFSLQPKNHDSNLRITDCGIHLYLAIDNNL
jgi:hypothetical protein